jgi:hypothetical protein
MHNINTLKTQLNPICHLLALLGAHPILHVSRIRVNKNVRQGYVFSFEGCEALNAEGSRRDYNVHRKRSFHIRT